MGLPRRTARTATVPANASAPMAASTKTAAKTAVSPKTGAVIPLGAHPGNTGGKKGRSGRRPDNLKAFLKSLRSNEDALEALKKAACDPESRGFAIAWKAAMAYDEEKPAERTVTAHLPYEELIAMSRKEASDAK